MANYKKFLYTLICFSSIHSFVSPRATATLYGQTNPELLQNIKIENPTKPEQDLITVCQLVEKHGIKFLPAQSVNWEAIKSVQMITEILPRIHRTSTTFGYIALAQQCAQMTSDFSKLRNKVNLLKYFDNNPDVLAKLNMILKRSQPALETYLELSKTHNEEEQANQDSVNRKLYYTSILGSKLNENSNALGFWTRINQLHTAAWYIMPSLLGSNIHRGSNYGMAKWDLISKNLELLEAISSDKQDVLVKDIKTLQDYIEKNPFAGKKAYRSLINGIKKIDAQKQTSLEKALLHSSMDNLIETIFAFWQTDRFETLKYLALFFAHLSKHATTIGISNMPSFYSSLFQGATSIIKDQYQKPLYTELKKELVLEGWNKDETKTKIAAGLQTSLIYAWLGVIAGAYPYQLYRRYMSTKELFDLVADKQKDLVQMSFLIQSLQKVTLVLQKNNNLKLYIPEHKKLAQLFNPQAKETSSDLKNLVSLLLSSSFAEESYYLSQQGKILSTHHLFMRVKHELIPYLQMYGYIDAYVSTYKLYAEFKDVSHARICLPEFNQQNNPQLVIKEFWHPLINHSKVVTNSLSLGTNDALSNLMITGPNAGGKTTTLMALIINIIMAQSYGIATATNFSLTPFAKIHSYLDITTNLLDGESLFKAEVSRSKKLKESILACAPGEKAFTIIDELFTGTNPEIASNVGFKFGELLGNIEHSMSIITTHFPKLTELEEATGRFTNYKVADAHISSDGSISYPFKLEKGISSQNIAQHMLEQEGII